MNESDDYLAENLLKLLDYHQMNESDLARKLKLPYNTIHRLLTGTTSDPRVSTLQQIADYFGVSLDYLINKNTPKTCLRQKPNYSIPIISWVEVREPDFKKHLKGDHKYIEIAQIDNINQDRELFALESTKSMQPRFPTGTTFIVDLNEYPVDGDLILVRFKENNSVSLRELIIDSPNWQLNAIIPGSTPLIYSPKEHEIIGIVVLTVIYTRNI